jgi:2,3-dihydroxyphenylpropionate 1,2-dioxygenase
MISMTLCASHAPGIDRDNEARFGTVFRHGLDQVRSAVADFGPDVVVLFGGDHRRAFAHVTPSFAVARTASLLAEGSIPAEELRVPSDLADALSQSLIADNFDIAVCRAVALDHAFGQALHHLLPENAGLEVVPVPINCASPPLPTARRVLEFGERVGDFFASLDKRVLFIGTGGLSHNPPSLVSDRHDLTEDERRELREAGIGAASKQIKPDWDNAFLDAIGRWDVDALLQMTDNATAEAGVGANEVRTWIAATAAGKARGLTAVAYEPVPEWITGMGVAMSSPLQ